MQTSISTTQLAFSSLVSQQNNGSNLNINRTDRLNNLAQNDDNSETALAGGLRTSRFLGPIGNIQLNEDSASSTNKSRSPRNRESNRLNPIGWVNYHHEEAKQLELE